MISYTKTDIDTSLGAALAVVIPPPVGVPPPRVREPDRGLIGSIHAIDLVVLGVVVLQHRVHEELDAVADHGVILEERER